MELPKDLEDAIRNLKDKEIMKALEGSYRIPLGVLLSNKARKARITPNDVRTKTTKQLIRKANKLEMLENISLEYVNIYIKNKW